MTLKTKLAALLTAFTLTTLTLTGCESSSKNAPVNTSSTETEVVETYANIVLASYQDSLSTAETMKTAIEALISDPSESTLEAAKEAWLAARVVYGQTEGYRFANGPIDDDNGPEGLLNAWPLDEAYIDYVEGNATSGIINDSATYPTISVSILEELNEAGGDTNISTGYHAIEFLLWGQDLSDGPGAGERPYTDYLTTGGTASNQDRRGAYLLAVTDLLIENLEYLVDAWATGDANNYRATFLALDTKIALKNIFTGIATLSASELSGERMSAALNSREKEEEHSCFSDNTHVDVRENARSISNVYLGSYTRPDDSIISGTSLYDLGKLVNSTRAETIKTQVLASVAATSEIQAPFDQEIRADNADGNARIETAIDALEAQGETLVELAADLGIQLSIEE